MVAKKKKPSRSKPAPKRKVPTAVLIAVPLVLTVGLAYKFAAPRTSNQEQTGITADVDVPQPKVLEGKTVPFRMTIPNANTWQRLPAEEGNEIDLALVHKPSHTELAVKVIGPLENPFLTANDVVSVLLHDANSNAPEARLIARAPLDTGGMAVLVHRVNVANGQNVEELTAFYVQDDQLFVVDAFVSPNEFSQVQAELEAVLRSFVPPPRQPIPSAIPPPPFDIAAPAAPPTHVKQVDLRKVEVVEIVSAANEAHLRNDNMTAVQLWYWATTRGGTHHMSELASCYAGLGQTDAALYWLQQAASKARTDPRRVEAEPNFESLRKDPRWSTVRSYLWEVSRYWAYHGPEETLVVVPKGYVPGHPIPVVVGLHGYGATPKQFADEQWQHIADKYSIAFISASGTVSRGLSAYDWTESVEKDASRIERALTQVAGRVTPAPGQIILQGFSQGAQMAAEIAARHPDRYAGAIALSPGTRRNMGFHDVEKKPQLTERRFVVVVGAQEEPRNVAYAKQDAETLRSYGAEVIHKESPNQAQHAFPADYETALSEWLKWILRK